MARGDKQAASDIAFSFGFLGDSPTERAPAAGGARPFQAGLVSLQNPNIGSPCLPCTTPALSNATSLNCRFASFAVCRNVLQVATCSARWV
ncbi:hypothetical protein JG687_00012675 [Phytophthora cactorum]|uniref:Uncharacterized protein n=1 Tax=Phytophthora cactorum TaxID=29920 RepID=A0A329RP16_9STRA|nr:hypothetical protein PC129_g7288 [Phytophthora cactorum]KAG6952976.1 hypothetical protein JG687_00012675 [Phytophthora cactorum]RAW25112.1 hypothetical protein PC110_g18469 [Phytophthora cactorum]